MSSEVLLLEKKDGIALITLNRPEAMNALSAQLRAAIAEAFRDVQRDGSVRVAILTGAGRAFCAGLDLKELGGEDPDSAAAETEGGLIAAMAAFDGPIIAGVNGYAITGGFELALACDMMIASTEAKFADTHARVGILPGWGLSQKLPRLIGIARAKELSFTGNMITAQQAWQWGLVNHVVEPEALVPTCRALATDMLSCVPEALKTYKRVINEGYAMNLSQAMALELQISVDSARRLTAANVAERRDGVIARGRQQAEKG
jgi:enoyl-CoA hydratase